MRQVVNRQMRLGQVSIGSIKLDVKSRDDIPRILLGLQYIYCNKPLRESVFAILEEIVPLNKNGKPASSSRGRPGMNQWEILVLGMLRLCLNTDYDRLHDLSNNHQTIRQMLGCGNVFDPKVYKRSTIQDNLRLFTVEHLDRINQLVVHAGHQLLGHAKDQKISGRADSFVLKTDVCFPTDTRLLFTAIRKVIGLCREIHDETGLGDWRQSRFNIKQMKRQYRKIQLTKRSNSKKEEVKLKKEKEIAENVSRYLSMSISIIERAKATLEAYEKSAKGFSTIDLNSLRLFMNDACLFIDQVDRRMLQGETIPQDEKLFSIFQRHTEWICKGKAGAPVELGLRVCVVEDRSQFILHHQVMEQKTDDAVAVSIVEETIARFSNLSVISMDKGFHSKSNQENLKDLLDIVVMPKKGKLSKEDKERESDPEFVRLRLDRSGVESAINSLQVHGLDICRDHGIEGLKRYTAMAVLAHNIHRIGAIIRQKELKKKKPIKKAA